MYYLIWALVGLGVLFCHNVLESRPGHIEKGFGTLMQQALQSGTLRIAGGGITSPDNLIPHGEAFLRDYLVGYLAGSLP